MPRRDQDLTGAIGDALAEGSIDAPGEWQREIRCRKTGRRVVAARPGQRKITSEEVRALLGEGDECE